MKVTKLMTELTGVSAFSTHAGFNVCTYAGADNVESDLCALENLTGISRNRMFFPIQTHSSEVKVVDDGADLHDVDGVVTMTPGVLIGVHTADCLPLLMADVEAGVIAAVHCGWRGVVGDIHGRALELMEQCGANAERIHAAMGPCICPACFEVGDEVASLFPEEAVLRLHHGNPHVDLARAVELRLKQAGVRVISRPPACSKHSSDFYSVRRQGHMLSLRTLTGIFSGVPTK